MAAACVGVFAGVLIVITGVELVAGRPLSDVVHGKQGSGTSVLGDTRPADPVPTRDRYADRRHRDPDDHGHRHAGDHDGHAHPHGDSDQP